jgi:hypothetical protein
MYHQLVHQQALNWNEITVNKEKAMRKSALAKDMEQ